MRRNEVELGSTKASPGPDYRLLVENTSDIVLLVRLDGVIEWVSPSLRETLGWAPQEWIGKRNIDIVHPDHRAQFEERARQVVASGQDSRFEFQVSNADGSSVWKESVGRLAADEEGSPRSRVVRLRSIQREIEAREARAASEELLRLAMSSAPIGMCLISVDGSFKRVNPALCELLSRMSRPCCDPAGRNWPTPMMTARTLRSCGP